MRFKNAFLFLVPIILLTSCGESQVENPVSPQVPFVEMGKVISIYMLRGIIW